MDEFLKIAKACADKNRLLMLKILQDGGRCVCEIQSVLKIAQPTVSKHLKILEEAGLVAHKKEGLWVVYELTKGEKSPYAALILGNLRHWFEADPWWGKIREKLLTLDRYKAAEEAKLCRGKRWKKV